MTTSSVRRSPNGSCQIALSAAGIGGAAFGRVSRRAASQGPTNRMASRRPASDASPRIQWLRSFASHTKPLARTTFVPSVRVGSLAKFSPMRPFRVRPLRAALSFFGLSGRRLLKTIDEMPNSSVSGVCSPMRASFSQSGCWAAVFISNSPVPRISFGSTRPIVASTSFAVGLNFVTSARSRARATSSRRSILFMTITLANSI
mmetsp:Transcript_6586/g.16735  ORF Transcript_6586/g.16735 Transcript_6586/m.16735 type:complete len:203 (+) Transcript_6586:431-1039(+)